MKFFRPDGRSFSRAIEVTALPIGSITRNSKTMALSKDMGLLNFVPGFGLHAIMEYNHINEYTCNLAL